MIHMYLLVLLLNGKVQVFPAPSLKDCEAGVRNFLAEASLYVEAKNYGAKCVPVDLKLRSNT